MPRELPEGLYEALVSLGLRDSLKASGLTSKFDDPDAGDSAQWFARYVSVELARVLDALKPRPLPVHVCP